MWKGKRFQSRNVILISVLVLFTVIFILPVPAHSAERLALGIHPYLPPTEIYDRFLPLAQYLGRETGMDVELSISKSYEEHIDRIGRGELDLAFMGPASFVLMLEKYGSRPLLAVLQVKGVQTFQGVIIEREDSSLRTLFDLKGKRFAFGDPSSTMSHLVPRYMLWKEGVDVSDLKSYEFLDNHENVALGVLAGAFDAGAVKMEVFEKYKDKGLVALAYTPEIAEHVFVASSKLSEDSVNSVRTALLALDRKKEGKDVLGSIKMNVTALVPASRQDYDPLMEIIDTLEKMGVSP